VNEGAQIRRLKKGKVDYHTNGRGKERKLI
jgi:hypothetical protein